MGKLGLAFKAFFRTLRDEAFRRQIEAMVTGAAGAAPAMAAEPAKHEPEPLKKAPPAPAKPRRSEALTLLATLQREARLVDFLMEPLTEYTDAQIGAAVRDVHRDAAAALARMFAIRALVPAEEGSEIDVPAGFDAARFRLTGSLAGAAPYHGRLCHHGWEATKVELGEWTGDAEAARVVAPVEVEVGTQ